MTDTKQPPETEKRVVLPVDPTRRTEIDAITGALVELATRHGVEVPVSRSVLTLVRFLEARGTH